MQTPSRKINPLKKLFMWRSPRTPLEYSNVLEDIEKKVFNGEPVPYVAFEQLLKKLANSARNKDIWADMDKATHLIKIMQKVGYQLDGSCYRSLLQVAVEECCRGDLVKTDLMGILNQIETSPEVEVRTFRAPPRAHGSAPPIRPAAAAAHALALIAAPPEQVDLDMLNLLLGGLAGLASPGRASLRVPHSTPSSPPRPPRSSGPSSAGDERSGGGGGGARGRRRGAPRFRCC